MSVVLKHFFDRTFPVIKHPEYRLVRQRNGSIWFAKLPCLLTCRLHEVDHNPTETFRDLPSIQEIENKIAVMLVNQAFQLLLYRLTLENASNVVTQRDDNNLPNLFVLKGDRRCWEFRHTEFREKVYCPTDNDQFPHVENNGNPGNDERRRNNEGFEWKASGNVEQHYTDRQRQQEQDRDARKGFQKSAAMARDIHWYCPPNPIGTFSTISRLTTLPAWHDPGQLPSCQNQIRAAVTVDHHPLQSVACDNQPSPLSGGMEAFGKWGRTTWAASRAAVSLLH